jgi:STE24 endopeptidase
VPLVSDSRAILILAVVAFAAAGVLALASRTPASVRNERVPPGATDPSLGARFTHAEVERNADYSRPGYLSFALQTLVGLVTLVVLARGPIARMVDAMGKWPGGWPVRVAITVAVVVIVATLASLPLAFVRGYATQHAWGRSTQDVLGWLSDQWRSLLVTGVTAMIAGLAFFALVRWHPRAWWVWTAAAFSLLTALVIYLYPVVITPLFNRFTPLQNPELVRQIKELGAKAGLPVDQVQVADASRRSTAENAYVAGLGSTRRVVVYDTLLQNASDKEVLFVVGHELGHVKENHILKGLVVAIAGYFVAFAALGWLATKESLWRWGGASGVADARAIPLLLLFATVASVITLPISNAISRHFEAQADRVGVTLTQDPNAAVRAFRQLALHDLADLDPPQAAVIGLYTHPPIPDRIRAVLAARAAAP